MKDIVKASYVKPLAVYLIITLVTITTFAGPAEAMFITATPHQDTFNPMQPSMGRSVDLARIQAALESKIVSQKLMDYGLSPAEALARVNRLSDEQLHALATHTDSLQAGGDGADLFFGLVIVALLVVVLVFLLQGRVEIRK